jgi:hypothetical protein
VFDINKFKEKPTKDARYSRMLEKLRSKERYTHSIEKAVDEAISNLEQGGKAFVIYGEPQSGKTEMMIALTAKLLDQGSKIIVLLLNDNVQLLTQTLDRFRRSGLDPAPKNFNEILDSSIEIGENEWVIFCKKNSSDLQKLLGKLGGVEGKVVIDDEADYATHNTFDNDNERWVDFPPHPDYTGADVFFPLEVKSKPLFSLNLLPDTGDIPKHLRDALLSFFVNVAYLNLRVNASEHNYSILIHTSGKKADHTEDYQQVVKTFNVLKNDRDRDFEKYLKKVWAISQDRYPGHEDEITRYLRENVNRNTIVVINSERDKKLVDYTSATNPSTLFTVAIGGNIVSRGVTFDNLLSMFFTRDVKHRIQQDTYIQRARMFGSRGAHVPYFELTIPEQLYLDWHRCFIFHRLSLESIRAGNGSPAWLEDNRIAAVSASSIDRATVDMDSGEMSFEMFAYTPEVEALIMESIDSRIKLHKLSGMLGGRCLPEFLTRYIENFSPQGERSLAIHGAGSIDGFADADKERIERKKGLIGKSDREEAKYPHATHHIKIYKNSKGKARVFYRYVGSIKFLKNLR